MEKKIVHVKGTDIYECVQFGAVWMNWREPLGLGFEKGNL